MSLLDLNQPPYTVESVSDLRGKRFNVIDREGDPYCTIWAGSASERAWRRERAYRIADLLNGANSGTVRVGNYRD